MRETYEFTLDGVRWTIDPPRQESYAADASNDSSLIVSIRNGSNNLLFMGDAQTERIREFLSTDHTKYTFLKVPHHGRGEPLMEAPLQSALPSNPKNASACAGRRLRRRAVIRIRRNKGSRSLDLLPLFHNQEPDAMLRRRRRT